MIDNNLEDMQYSCHNQKEPMIALIAILDKRNAPILIKNFLVDQHANNDDEK